MKVSKWAMFKFGFFMAIVMLLARIKKGFLRIFSKEERQKHREEKKYNEEEIFKNLAAKEFYVTSRGGRKALKISYTLKDGKIQEKKEEVKLKKPLTSE